MLVTIDRQAFEDLLLQVDGGTASYLNNRLWLKENNDPCEWVELDLIRGHVHKDSNPRPGKVTSCYAATLVTMTKDESTAWDLVCFLWSLRQVSPNNNILAEAAKAAKRHYLRLWG